MKPVSTGTWMKIGTAALLTVLIGASCSSIGRSGGSQGETSGPERLDFARILSLHHAHAHNDYLHPHPLYDALSNGFNSVEADIWLVDGKLLVGHNRFALEPGRTLEALYLEPLMKIVAAGGGGVYGPHSHITLLVDVKSEAEPTYRALERSLARYRAILTTFQGTGIQEGPVEVVVSGNRDLALMKAEPLRYAAYDGRLPDLSGNEAASLIPLISDRWGTLFSWRGVGAMPEDQLARLKTVVAQAHAAGRKVRFWGTPDEPGPARDRLWTTLLSAGVDYLNTDHLSDLRSFLLNARK